MYMRPASGPGRFDGVQLAPAAAGALALSIAAILVFGFWPGDLLDLAGRSAQTLTQTGMPVAGR
jgi:hypothetical protein